MTIRILFFINNLNVGGAETLLLKICNGLIEKENEYKIKVIIFENKKNLAPKFEELGIEVACLNAVEKGPIYKIVASFKEIKKFRPDIVHTHLLLSDRFGQIAALLAGVKIKLSTGHNMTPKKDFQRSITFFLTSRIANKIIVVSKSAKKFYIDNIKYPANKLIVIHNCPSFTSSNTSKKRKLNLKGLSKLVKCVNIGKYNRQKGQVFLIEAMKLLEDSPFNVRLDLYGEESEDYSEQLMEKCALLNLTNVHFRGVTDNVQKVLSESDIFIASSLWEGFHMAIVEAMSLGIPVIATDIPPHRELFEGVKEKLLVEPANSKAIAGAILQLLNKPPLYSRLSEQMIERAQFFSIGKTIKNYDNLYKSLIFSKNI